MRHCVLLSAGVAVILAGGSIPAQARTLIVPTGYPSIAAAMSSAAYGDTVQVACGTYFERNIAVKSGVTVRGVTGEPSCVTVDATGIGRVFLCNAVDANTRFAGLTIRGGRVGSSAPAQGGAGMLCVAGAAPRIENCVFERNVATSGLGGGLNCYQSSPTVTNSIFRQNAAVTGGGAYCESSEATFDGCSFVADSVSDAGGGICASYGGVTITGCEFTGNKSGIYAGGLALSGISFPVLANCVFSGNQALYGGGIDCTVGASPTISHTTFSGNSAGSGGGLYCSRSVTSAVLTECLFVSNQVLGAGGGAILHDNATAQFVGCVFWQNHASSYGGAARCLDDADATFTNCTFAFNSSVGGGGALNSVNSYPVLDQCIFAFQTSGLVISCLSSTYGMPQLACCNSFGNVGGDWAGTCVETQAGMNGNFSADPRFCDGPGGDLTLRSDSPCLPGQHPAGYACGLVGAEEQGCVTASVASPPQVPSSWGRLKGQFSR